MTIGKAPGGHHPSPGLDHFPPLFIRLGRFLFQDFIARRAYGALEILKAHHAWQVVHRGLFRGQVHISRQNPLQAL
jgi:hypothetical protein